MKIDLHCHTLKVKVGDSIKRNIDSDCFVKKIKDAEIEIVAITNHNLFDISQYNEFKLKSNNEFQIWPGIELDINDEENKKSHLIVIANPLISKEFYEITTELINGISPDDFCTDVEVVVEKFKNKDIIYIAHFGEKKQSISENTIKKLDCLITEKYRLFKEPSNFKTMSIMSKVGFNTVIGSDVSDWNEYNESNFAELKLNIDSFERFIMLSKKDCGTVKTLLEKKEKKNLEIKIKIDNTKKINFNIPIYNDVNILFGPKGTGKTKILDGIKEKYELDGEDVSFYAAKDADTTIDNMLKENPGERNLKKFDLEYLEKYFEDIKIWKEVIPTSIKQYINYGETKDYNSNKEKLKITKMRKINNISLNKYEIEKDKLKKLKTIIAYYKTINLNNILESTEIKQLDKINKKIYKILEEGLKKEYFDYTAKEFTNNCIEVIKDKSDMFTTSKSLPGNTGFLDFAKNRLKLKINIERILKVFEGFEKTSKNKIGELDNEKCIYLKTIYKTYSDSDLGYKYGKTSRVLKLIFKTIKKIKDNYCTNINDDIMNLISNIKEEDISIDNFLGIKRIFVNQEDEEYVPSDGEKMMLVLHKALMEKSNIYLLDEPERSLGNSFINDVVLPRINNIAKEGKIIIIATHNANIAVRTLPFNSILKDYNNGKYNTYIGNPFTNILINIEDKNDIRDWKYESMKILEGGKDAFIERENIYESR